MTVRPNLIVTQMFNSPRLKAMGVFGDDKSSRNENPPRLDVTQSRAFGSLSPLHTPTRLNAHTISTASLNSEPEMTHLEWLASLEPRIRNAIDSHGYAVELEHLDAEGRASIERSAERFLIEIEYLDHLWESLGPNVTGLRVSFYPQRLVVAFFENVGAKGENKIKFIFEDGSDMFLEVSKYFSARHFDRFLNEDLPRLREEYGLLDSNASVHRLRRIFENFFSLNH